MSREKDAVKEAFDHYGIELREGDLTQDTREFGNPGSITVLRNLSSLSTDEMDELSDGVIVGSGISEHLLRITQSRSGNKYELLVTKAHRSDKEDHKVLD